MTNKVAQVVMAFVTFCVWDSLLEYIDELYEEDVDNAMADCFRQAYDW